MRSRDRLEGAYSRRVFLLPDEHRRGAMLLDERALRARVQGDIDAAAGPLLPRYPSSA